MPRIALLFVLIPILELALLVQLGRAVGFWPTLAFLVAAGVAGAALTRAAGLRLVLSIRSELAAGRMPSQALLDGLALLVAGALLLTPGLITDVLAFGLLFTPSRRWLQKMVLRWLEGRIRSGQLQVSRVGSMYVFGGTPRDAPRGLDPRNEVQQRRPR